MNETKKTPIERLTDSLADMTAVAIELERERNKAKQSATDWYNNWLKKDAEVKEANEKIRELDELLQEAKRQLRLEQEEHENTRAALREAMTIIEEVRKAECQA